MRLIDADKLEEELHDYIGNYSGRTWFEIRDILGEAEEVKAIPVDYILKWACAFLDPYCEAYLMALDLIKDWKKENEID